MKSSQSRVTDPGKILQSEFAFQSGAKRTTNVGLDWVPVGSITSAVQVGPGNAVMVYNSTGATLFIAFGGASTVAAPTAASNGIPVLAGEKFVVSSGSNAWVIGSATGLFAYVGDTQ